VDEAASGVFKNKMQKDTVIYKICNFCHISKPISAYYFSEDQKDGVRSKCKQCMKNAGKAWRKNNVEIIKQKRKEHREKAKYYFREYRKAKPEKNRAATKKWSLAHPEKKLEMARRWRSVNQDKLAIYIKRAVERRRLDVKARLAHSMQSGITSSIQSGSKGGRHWEFLTGYTINELKNHLEKRFKNGMAWENYGTWHIDHKIPISAFHFETPDDIDFRKCWALENLQPLWSEENQRKYNKLINPFQPSLAING
jgi:hypothetical protein